MNVEIFARLREFESPDNRTGRSVNGKRCRRIDGIFRNPELAELVI